MDGLSGPASAIAVVSLAIQLGDSINKLCHFLSSIHNAPEDISSIIKDLQLLKVILNDIQRNEELYGLHSATALALEGCREKVSTLHTIVDTLAPGFAAQNSLRKNWNAIQAVRKSEKIREFRRKMEEAKTTLLLAQQCSMSHSQHGFHESQHRGLAAITQDLAELRLQMSHHSTTVTTSSTEVTRHLSDVHAEIDRMTSSVNQPILRYALTQNIRKEVQQSINTALADSPSIHGQMTCQQSVRSNDEHVTRGHYQKKRTRLLDERWSRTSTPFGTVWCISRRYTVCHSTLKGSYNGWTNYAQQETEFRTTFRFVPSWWLITCGFKSLVSAELVKSSHAGWRFCLNMQNLVPYDALIFAYCEADDIHAVRWLLESGQASVHDVDKDGWTPLHTKQAASIHSAELCSLLLSAGADIAAQFRDGSPLLLVTRTSLIEAPNESGRIIDTLRTLIKAGADLENESQSTAFWHQKLHAQNYIPRTEFESPAIYLINEILRLVRPEDFDSIWWSRRLYEALYVCPDQAPIRDAIMKFCDVLAVRRALLMLISVWHFIAPREQRVPTKISPGKAVNFEASTEDAKVLISRLDTLHFKMRAAGQAYECLTSMALKSSVCWSTYLSVLREMNIDLEEMARHEVPILNEIYFLGGGWTEEAVIKLYMPIAKSIFAPYNKLEFDCSWDPGYPHIGSVDRGGYLMWTQTIERIRLGKCPHGPFDEDELKVYEEWRRYVRIFNEQEICYFCQEKMKKKRVEEEEELEELESYNWMFDAGRVGHEIR